MAAAVAVLAPCAGWGAEAPPGAVDCSTATGRSTKAADSGATTKRSQVRRNHARVVDARRRADGLLTGREIRALRKSLGLSQKDASEVFGGGTNAFSKYERGEVVQSVAMDRLLRLVARYPLLLDDLRGHPGVSSSAGLDVSSDYVDDGPLLLERQHGYDTTVGSECATVVDFGEWKQMREAA